MTAHHSRWRRAIFILPAVAAAVPLMSTLIWVYRSVDAPVVPTIALVGSVVTLLICLVPSIHRLERFLAANLLGIDLGDATAPKAYRTAVIFSALHLSAGLAILLSAVSVPLAVSELAWRTEYIQVRALTWSEAVNFYLESVLWSEYRTVLVFIVLAAAIGAIAYFFCVPLLARHLLGPSLEQRLAESEADRERLEVQNELARDIHDSVGHALTIASLQAERGQATVGDDPDDAAQALATILMVSRRAQADLDEVLRVLRTGAANPSTKVRDLGSIGDLIDDARSAGLRVDVDVPLNLEVPPDRSRALYRIMQEALTNALRYASPRELTPTIATVEAGGLRISAHNPIDDHVQYRRGRGLQGIEARAHLLGGSSSAQVHAGRFWLEVIFPPRSSKALASPASQGEQRFPSRGGRSREAESERMEASSRR